MIQTVNKMTNESISSILHESRNVNEMIELIENINRANIGTDIPS